MAAVGTGELEKPVGGFGIAEDDDAVGGLSCSCVV